MKTTTLTKICTLTLLFFSGMVEAKKGGTIETKTQFGHTLPKLRDVTGRPAGMGLRLQQRTVNEFKSAMGKFLPHFLTYDIGINKKKEEWDFSALFGLINYHVNFSNIHYPEPSLDFSKVRIKFTDFFERPMLKVHFPAITSWRVQAHTSANTLILPKESEMVFDIEDLNFDFNTEFETNEFGYLRPILYATNLQWGETAFYHENFLLAVIFDQWIRFTLIIIQNSLYFLGDQIMNGMIEPVMTDFLNNYQFPLHLNDFFKGQDAQGDFFVDLRHVPYLNPRIGTGFMDFYFIGEMIYKDENCGDQIVDSNIHFFDVQDQSQLVIGESAFSCIANQWAKSDLGKIYLNEDKFNKLFMVEGYKLNTTSLGRHIKLFEEKVGSDKPLKFQSEFKNINIQFGKFDTDVVIDYTFCFSVHLDLLGARELFYDCIVMSTAANVRAENQILHIELVEHKVNLDTDGANRDKPKRNSMDMTVNEYRELCINNLHQTKGKETH